jgi:ABC-type Na+ efflux pump permease subunit
MRSHKQSPSGLRASLRRVRVVAGYALGEARHLRLGLVVGLAGAVICGAAFSLRPYGLGSAELKFIADFGWAMIGMTSMGLGALVMAQLFFRDLESRTVQAVLTRPVRRGEYLAGKLAGVAGWLAGYIAILGLLLTALLLWRGRQIGVTPFGVTSFFAVAALFWMKATLVAAMTLLVCSYADSVLFASCAGLLLALVGQLRSLTGGGGLTALQVWPNLALFDPEKLLAGPAVAAAAWLPGLTLYWATYLLLFGALASYGFRHREF